jgi:imidazolonepropionase-like amidohydrolase
MLPVLLAPVFLAAAVSGGSAETPAPGAEGGPGLALLAAKILAVPHEGTQFYDHAVLLVKNGKIEAVGERDDVAVPDGYVVEDLGDSWLAPGFIDLHCHAAGANLFAGVNDLNDMVFLANPGLRASAAVEPHVWEMRQAIAGGVTTVLYIPGSGTNIGGQGVLVKTAFPEEINRSTLHVIRAMPVIHVDTRDVENSRLRLYFSQVPFQNDR